MLCFVSSHHRNLLLLLVQKADVDLPTLTRYCGKGALPEPSSLIKPRFRVQIMHSGTYGSRDVDVISSYDCCTIVVRHCHLRISTRARNYDWRFVGFKPSWVYAVGLQLNINDVDQGDQSEILRKSGYILVEQYHSVGADQGDRSQGALETRVRGQLSISKNRRRGGGGGG